MREHEAAGNESKTQSQEYDPTSLVKPGSLYKYYLPDAMPVEKPLLMVALDRANLPYTI